MRNLRAVRTNFLIDRASNRSFESCSGHFYDPTVLAVDLVVLHAVGNPEARRAPWFPARPEPPLRYRGVSRTFTPGQIRSGLRIQVLAAMERSPGRASPGCASVPGSRAPFPVRTSKPCHFPVLSAPRHGAALSRGGAKAVLRLDVDLGLDVPGTVRRGEPLGSVLVRLDLGVEQRHLAADPIATLELPGPRCRRYTKQRSTPCLQESQPVPASPPRSRFTALQHP